jgi:UDP-N-acetylmuramoyl-tripeptide--D-alanyl-D-alanine ligase
MLEMGELSGELHGELSGPLLAAGIEHVWMAGPEMAALKAQLPESVSTIWFETTDELAAYALTAVHGGDVVMVKSSLGLGFGKIVAVLLDKYPSLDDTRRPE